MSNDTQVASKTQALNTTIKIALVDGIPRVDSREIAELTGKQHKNVLRDIDNIVKSLSSDLSLAFKSTTYQD